MSKFHKYKLLGAILPKNFRYVGYQEKFEENDCCYDDRVGVMEQNKIARQYIGVINENHYPLKYISTIGYVRKLPS